MTILKLNSELLHKPTTRFDFNNPPTNPLELAIDLTETMLYHNGLGLAANQCGFPYRVCVIASDPIIAMFNPSIVDISEKTEVLEEGCLSYPGIITKVKRPKAIKVRYTQPNGEVITTKYNGMTARIVCHEVQHLEGRLFTDDLSKFELRRLIEKHNKQHKTNYSISNFRNIESE